jgi:hypothetical protein
MALAVATPTQTSVSSNSAVLADTGQTGGVGPYTYQWYISTTTGFSPGAGSLVAGAVNLSQSFSGLIPNTPYFAKIIVTDVGNGSATATSSQLAFTTAASSLSPNSFAQSPILGMIDLRFGFNTISCLVDSSQATVLYQGSAVKIVDSADGVPKVVGCAANSDEVLGFINYDVKSISFAAGVPCEVSLAGNCMYLYATGAISRGVQVSLDLSSPGSVRASAGNTGDDIVGWAYDKAAASGALIRVILMTPSFKKA